VSVDPRRSACEAVEVVTNTPHGPSEGETVVRVIHADVIDNAYRTHARRGRAGEYPSHTTNMTHLQLAMPPPPSPISFATHHHTHPLHPQTMSLRSVMSVRMRLFI
jgi:hypothetical protein